MTRALIFLATRADSLWAPVFFTLDGERVVNTRRLLRQQGYEHITHLIAAGVYVTARVVHIPHHSGVLCRNGETRASCHLGTTYLGMANPGLSELW
jgi:hypothetical protein